MSISPVPIAPPPEEPTERPGPPPGRTPRGLGLTPFFAQLIAVGLVALGVVGVQEGLVRTGVLTGPSWVPVALDHLDGSSRPGWLLAAGIGAVVVGVALVVAALVRGRRTTVALYGRTGLHLRTEDLARLLDDRLVGLDDASSTSVKVSRRRVRVNVVSMAALDRDEELRLQAGELLTPVLAALDGGPRLKVRVSSVGRLADGVPSRPAASRAPDEREDEE